MNTPKNPDERLSPEQRKDMVDELAELRLRAEHGLLKRLVAAASFGTLDASDAAAGLQALVALSR